MRRRTNIATIILVPITKSEKEYCETIKEYKKHIYILYRSPNKGGIQMKPDLKEGSIRNKDKACFFGVESLKELNLDKVIDRPIYKIYSKNKTTIENYEILNSVSNNPTDVWLDNIISGSYKIENNNEKQMIKK